MKKLMIIALILVGALLIPAVSAIDVTSLPYTDTKVSQTFDFYQRHVVVGGTGASQGSGGLTIYMAKVQNYQNVHYASLEVDSDVSALTEGNINAFYDRPSDNSRQPCLLQVRKTRNLLGMVTKTVVYCYLQNWEVGAATGAYQSYIYKEDGSIYCYQGGLSYPIVDLTYIDGNPEYDSYFAITRGGKYNQISYVEGYSDCWHMLNLRQEKLSCAIEIIRNVDGKSYFSIIDIYDSNGLIISDAASVDADYLVGLNSLHHINITSGVNTYTYNLLLSESPQEPSTDSTVTVYVQNSQTGAMIADTHIDISAFVNGEFHEVVNETLPGGIYTGNLQPTGGGLPNPDYYRLIATAEGYNSIMPYIDFEVDGETTIYAILDPIGGAPENVNNTFIDFYVRDINANPIAGATVKFGGYTLYTNNAGYTIFEVKKDKTYTWSVNKLGYGSVTGNAVIGSDARHTINAVIAPEVTPTTPTTIPSVTPIKPTPTLTAPNGEPVNNLLEWFAAHFGMILGGGVEIGKIFMWLCFTIPTGVYVGNKAKAGAAGFMAGAGIVTLFFVLIGWVPIWLVVLLALLIGLLYAKVYSNTDNGGGR